MARMKRLQISLAPEMDRELARAAELEGVSKAEVVRRSLDERLRPKPEIDLPVSSAKLRPGIDLADARALRKLMPGLGD